MSNTTPEHVEQRTSRFNDRDAEIERKRSIVLTNVPESSEPSAFARNSSDFNRVNQILDFLGVECRPLSVFRMGRPQQNRPRLIKVVLPSSRHQAEAVRRAPRLRFLPPHKGIFLRPSLSREGAYAS